MRLTNKGKEYQESLKKRTIDSKNMDADGNRMFVPAMYRTMSAPAMESVNNTSSNTISAGEFMYQDAKDKEERARVRNLEYDREIESIASTPKITPTSSQLLWKKAVSELNYYWCCNVDHK